MKHWRRGKSLVEILVVIAIIALLGAMVFSVGHLAWKAVRNLTKGVSAAVSIADRVPG